MMKWRRGRRSNEPVEATCIYFFYNNLFWSDNTYSNIAVLHNCATKKIGLGNFEQ